jgi:SAM-dependent methyltransferase
MSEKKSESSSYAFQYGEGLPQARLKLQHQILEPGSHSFLEKNLTSSMDVFEYGCGSGETTQLISKFVPSGSIFAIDKNQKQIDCAKNYLNNSKVTFSTQDLTQPLTLPKTFDASYGRYVIEHFNEKDRKIALDNCIKTLKSDGILLIEEADLNKIFYGSNNHAVDRLAELYKDCYILKFLGTAKN